MDPLLISAASGMRARMESLEMLANNLANASTGGYKTDREFYSIYTAAEASDPASAGISPEPDQAPLIQKHWTDHSQGNLRQTGRDLDLSLDGQGFFAVNGPNGILYTRNGSLKVSASGQLTTADGYALRTTTGQTVTLQSNSPFQVDVDGNVIQDGQPLGQLAVVNFPDQNAIDKRGMNYFFSVDPKLVPQRSSAQVHQGSLEESNVGSAESAIRMVSVMRQFESLQKAISIGADMNKHAVEEVARVAQ
jgi:flagellar basal-body rod protein FlgF